ncbi:MAG: 3-keto-5-aminohexanoate cleavage protein [Thermoleophilaceae bacterium]
MTSTALEGASGTSAIKQAVPPLLQAALNGSRTPAEHPAVPRTPDELAAEARAAVDAGDGVASWAVNARALERGHGIRTGLEDTTVLPDGRRAPGNGALVSAAARMMELGP